MKVYNFFCFRLKSSLKWNYNRVLIRNEDSDLEIVLITFRRHSPSLIPLDWNNSGDSFELCPPSSLINGLFICFVLSRRNCGRTTRRAFDAFVWCVAALFAFPIAACSCMMMNGPIESTPIRLTVFTFCIPLFVDRWEWMNEWTRESRWNKMKNSKYLIKKIKEVN